MDDIFQRLWDNLTARLTGRMNFRLVPQPVMARGFVICSGVKDARAGVTAFLWTGITEPAQRSRLPGEAWKDVGKVFVLAMVLDAVYQVIQVIQVIAQRGVFLFELLIVAPLLALVPYILLRGPVTRLVAMFMRRTST
jgi:hypothetical protein